NPSSPPCVPDPLTSARVCPYADHNDKNYGGPHGNLDIAADMDCADFASRTGCGLDGFVRQRVEALGCDADATFAGCVLCPSPAAAGTGPCECLSHRLRPRRQRQASLPRRTQASAPLRLPPQTLAPSANAAISSASAAAAKPIIPADLPPPGGAIVTTDICTI